MESDKRDKGDLKYRSGISCLKLVICNEDSFSEAVVWNERRLHLSNQFLQIVNVMLRSTSLMMRRTFLRCSIPAISFVFIQAWLMGSGSRMSPYRCISVPLPLSWHHMLTRGDTQLSPPVAPKSLSPALKLTLDPQDRTMFKFTPLTFCTREKVQAWSAWISFTFLTGKPERAIYSENVFYLVLEVKNIHHGGGPWWSVFIICVVLISPAVVGTCEVMHSSESQGTNTHHRSHGYTNPMPLWSSVPEKGATEVWHFSRFWSSNSK